MSLLLCGIELARYADKARKKPMDATTLYDGALTCISKGILADPASSDALFYRGDVFLRKATAEKEVGQDPSISLDLGIADLREVYGRDPGFTNALTALARALICRAELYEAQRHDPSSSYDEAIELFSVDLGDELMNLFQRYERGYTFKLKAESEVRRGIDPTRCINLAFASLIHVVEKAEESEDQDWKRIGELADSAIDDLIRFKAAAGYGG